MRRGSLILTLVALLALACAEVSAQADRCVFNEIMAANVEQHISRTWNFESWVELYNPSAEAVALGGCYLSDDASNLKKWKMPAAIGSVPARGYKVIWLGNNELLNTHCPFSLDADGGNIYLSDASGNLLTQASYPTSMERIAYARTTDGGAEWSFTASPTPGSDNSKTEYATQMLEAPVIEPASCLFHESVNVRTSIPQGCTLYYTDDGSLPTPSNGKILKSKYLIPTKTRVLRFRYYKDGFLPSPVTTRTYIKADRDYQLPIVSVVIDPRFLYDDSIGIYVKGVNGKPGIGAFSPVNWNMEWDRPASMTFIGTDGIVKEEKEVDMKIAGGWSRNNSMKPFKLKGKKKYGLDRDYHYPYFQAKPYLRNRTLFFRNGGNDNKALLKDAALGVIVQNSGIDIDVQSYEPVHHFINGEYRGMINIREPSNKHYVYANYGWDEDEIDAFEENVDSAYLQTCGTNTAFERLYGLTKSAKMSAIYKEICRRLDVDEFINYLAVSLYLGRGDWPHNNMKGFSKSVGGRLRLVLFDIDASFEQGNPFTYFEGKQFNTFNVLFNGEPQRKEEIKVVSMFLNLLQNDDFRKQFIDTFSLMGGSVFNYERSRDIVDSLYNRIQPTLLMENKSATEMAGKVKGGLQDRMESMMRVMQKYDRLKLADAKPITLKMAAHHPSARLLLNDLEVPYSRFDGKVFAPAVVKAVAPAGYAFSGWFDGFDQETTVFGYQTEWKYATPPADSDASWTAFDYDDSAWNRGKAPLGQGFDDILTPMAAGTDASGNRLPVALRLSHVMLSKPKADEQFLFYYKTSGSFILYINGNEAARFDASDAAGTVTRGCLVLPASLFRLGKNVYAVKMTADDGSGDALFWDARLNRRNDTDHMTLVSTEPELQLSEGTDYQLTALFQPLDPQSLRASGICPVRINEVSAANDVAVNEYIKRNDWIELFNTTADDIDVAGMYLSDDPDNPMKWAISGPQTLIPAFGHLVVWCDKLDAISQLHAPFKLDADGGSVVLSAADGSWSDRLDYPAHDGNSTIGRYPDGAHAIYFMPRPTIGKTNKLGMTAAYLGDAEGTGIHQPPTATPTTLALSYADRGLSLAGPGAAQTSISVYSVAGQQVPVMPTTLSSDYVFVDLSGIPAGVYVARAQQGDGTAVSCKFVVRR